MRREGRETLGVVSLRARGVVQVEGRSFMRRRLIVAAAVAAVCAVACSKTSEQKYSDAVDSGAVAPAARPDLKLTKNDTMSSGERTGKGGLAGDTLSARGRPDLRRR